MTYSKSSSEGVCLGGSLLYCTIKGFICSAHNYNLLVCLFVFNSIIVSISKLTFLRENLLFQFLYLSFIFLQTKIDYLIINQPGQMYPNVGQILMDSTSFDSNILDFSISQVFYIITLCYRKIPHNIVLYVMV